MNISTVGEGKQYPTLSAWANDREGRKGDEEVHVYGAIKDTCQIDGGGWRGRNVLIKAAPGERHLGTAGTGARVISAGGGRWCLRFNENGMGTVTIEDLEFDGAGEELQYGLIFLSGDDNEYAVRRCILHHNRGEGIYLKGRHETRIYNNIVYECQYGIVPKSGGVKAFLWNNTVYNCGTYGIGVDDGWTEAINNVVLGSGKRDFHDDYSETSSHNCSSDESAPGPHSLYQKNAGAQFVSIAEGAIDLHLKESGTDVSGKGKDLSAHFTDDVDGGKRKNWDMGGDEIGAPPEEPPDDEPPDEEPPKTKWNRWMWIILLLILLIVLVVITDCLCK